MCHLLLLLPVLALPVFWLWPADISIPVYAVVVVVSALLYWSMLKMTRRPVMTGREHVIGSTAEVVTSGEQLTVSLEGEHWHAVSRRRDLLPGERVKVLGMEGLTLQVAPDSDGEAEAHAPRAS